MNTKLMFSSETGKWDTQQSVIDDLATVFDWDCDVCASRPNVCDFYFNEEDDGLDQAWLGLCWMNPPYGREIGKWMRKARIRTPQAVVCLVPARTDTRWWQDNVPHASQVIFIRGRLTFGDEQSWIVTHQKNIMKKSATSKQLHDLATKIGGSLCTDIVKSKISGAWLGLDMPYSFTEWLNTAHLKKDSAPFPSAFVVFGTINERQSRKLASYGWSVSKGI